MLVGLACGTLGDVDSSARRLDAAHRVFTELGAAPALAELTRLSSPDGPPDGLTTREVEVLRLVASGKSNTQIAATLVLSERTVARHLQQHLRQDQRAVPDRCCRLRVREHGLC